MHQGMPKMAQSASKVSPDGPKWAHLVPFLRTLEALLHTLGALLATWGIPLPNFAHFYDIFVNNCAFFLTIHVNPTKIKRIALKIINIAQKHRKSA